MTARRYFLILSAIFIVMIGLIIGGTIGGNTLLKKRSAQLSELRIENSAIERQQTALLQAKKDVERYSELEKTVKSVVPQDKDQAKTVREIVQIAAENRIPVESITFESSTLGSKTTSTGSSSQKLPPVSQVKSVEGITGVYTLPIQVKSATQVDYQNFLKFLESLEKNRRTAHVSMINIQPVNGGRDVDFDLTLNAYVKP